ncbi:MAG: flagellar basal-body MS-ring/collar protein FliF, partial [Acidobacteriota bacterium]
MNPQQILAHVKRLQTTLSGGQIASLIAAFVAVVGVIAGSAYWASTPSYTVLYRDLDPESAQAVIAKLKTANTPYVLQDAGATLLVPATRVDELRLDFASQGLPTAGRIGFEIFDRTSFGTTEFLEHVNYRRGLEGELARTIAAISEVASARVHIALAKDSLFTGTAEQAKASVVLKLRTNRPLAAAAVAGIAGLVASAVESLRPESVVIVDTFGRPLSRPAEPEDADVQGQNLERQQKIEHELVTKVVNQIEPVVGVGHVRVNVAATVSADTAEQTEEVWDQSPVIRSRQTATDSTTTAAMSKTANGAPGGVAGARANAPPDLTTANPQAAGAANVAPGTSGRATETVNYEIGKKTRHTVENGGQLAKLSVAVLVDDVRVPNPDGTGQTAKPRDVAEMERIKSLVSAAVGLDAARGDQLTVENIGFDDSGEPVTVETPAPWWKQVSPTVVSTLGVSIGDILRLGLVALLALVALFAIIRPLARAAMTPGPGALLPAAEGAGAGPRTVAQLQGEFDPGPAPRDGRPAAPTR